MKALLIIDMQNESFSEAYPSFDAQGVVSRINALSDRFRKSGDKVILIQHDGTKDECYVPNTEGWQIISSIDKRQEDLIISKTANDSFYRTSLKNELLRYGIDELVITGSATDFCVDSTVKSALVNDINVTVISDAHTTTDRPGLKAKQLIDHYNWLWKETTPTNVRINVIDTEEYLKTLTLQ